MIKLLLQIHIDNLKCMHQNSKNSNHKKLWPQEQKAHTVARNKDDTTPFAKVHTRIVILQQSLIQRLRPVPSNGSQSLSRPKWVCDKQTIILRNRAIPTRTIHHHRQLGSIGYVIRRVVIEPLHVFHRRQVGIVLSRYLCVCVAGDGVVLKRMALKRTVYAATGERNIDPCAP